MVVFLNIVCGITYLFIGINILGFFINKYKGRFHEGDYVVYDISVKSNLLKTKPQFKGVYQIVSVNRRIICDDKYICLNLINHSILTNVTADKLSYINPELVDNEITYWTKSLLNDSLAEIRDTLQSQSNENYNFTTSLDVDRNFRLNSIEENDRLYHLTLDKENYDRLIKELNDVIDSTLLAKDKYNLFLYSSRLLKELNGYKESDKK